MYQLNSFQLQDTAGFARTDREGDQQNSVHSEKHLISNT